MPVRAMLLALAVALACVQPARVGASEGDAAGDAKPAATMQADVTGEAKPTGEAVTEAAPAQSGGSLALGTVAPDFSLTDIDGKTVKLSDALKKGPVLLDFWALWCKPCLRSLPSTEALHKEFGPKGLTVLAVNTDSPRSTAKVKPYVKTNQFSFAVPLDPNNTLQRLYHFSRIPQVFLIAKDGTIAYSQLGFTPANEQRLHQEVAKLFGAEGASAGGAGSSGAAH
jgi:peroxiredoxin